MNRPEMTHVGEEDGSTTTCCACPTAAAASRSGPCRLLPCARPTVIEKWQRESIPAFMRQMMRRLERMPELLESVHKTGPCHLGEAERGILALVNEERLRRNPPRDARRERVSSPYGIRSLSNTMSNPYVFHATARSTGGVSAGESNTGMFGGNSNWRGPVWMPVNAILIRALQNYYLYYGDNCRSSVRPLRRMMNLFEVSKESPTGSAIFIRDEHGRRPVYGGTEKFQN
jgi:hypothetical protein